MGRCAIRMTRTSRPIDPEPRRTHRSATYSHSCVPPPVARDLAWRLSHRQSSFFNVFPSKAVGACLPPLLIRAHFLVLRDVLATLQVLSKCTGCSIAAELQM